MIQFSSLRLSGFKSFVDKTELEIGPGLNGIVGPNGCGKSNLVEAMRWVMGESSAKRMRGSCMEDVIFSGTDKRSARNFAEVSLLLDNIARDAPIAYNNSDQIEITRKIERDKGSGYKINGKNSRARDVQMLFADTVTGANSPSLVSQGHITRMINAKPHDRRLILEESAGIAGLYARRHEAELRLKASDTNLLRVEDVFTSMETRLNALKRQSRQASKYKNISAQIRQLELVITYLEWQELINKQKDLEKEFAKSDSTVAQQLITVTQLTKTQNTQIEELPSLRNQEAELSVKLQKYKIDLQRLEEEEGRYKKELVETKTQLHQAQIDLQHEQQILDESSASLTKADDEYQSLLKEQGDEVTLYDVKLKNKNELEIKLNKLEEHFNAIKEGAAENRAHAQSLEKSIERNQNRLNIIITRKKNAISEKDKLEISDDNKKTILELENRAISLEKQLQETKNKTDKSLNNIKSAEEQTEISRETLIIAQKNHTEFSSEISTLEKFFQSDTDNSFTPILDSITTKTGFEKALSRAIGEALMASIDTSAPTNWRVLSQNIKLEELPTGSTSLTPHIDAPQELKLALSQIGFIDNHELGESLAPMLKAGQSLVSCDGHYWRWDGYCVHAHAHDTHSMHLEQKNKLIKLENNRTIISNKLEDAQEDLNKALSMQNTTKENYENLLSDIKNIETKLKELIPTLLKIKEKNLKSQSEKKRYEDQIHTFDEDITSLQKIIDKDKSSLETIYQTQNNGDYSDNIISQVKDDYSQARTEHLNAVREFDLLEQVKNTRRARVQAIADDKISVKNRSIKAKERLSKIKERTETLISKLSELKQNPIDTKRGNEEILSLISNIEKSRDQAIEKLSICENDVAISSKALKEAEQILGNARETRAHTNATLAAINNQLEAMESSIKEKLSINPHELKSHSAIDLAQYQSSDIANLKKNKDKLNWERDSMGSVNLCAEDETIELEKELTTLLNERNDLLQAIEELTGAVNKINKEARERLNVAFNHVNAHFKRLFSQLFAGGDAYLKLIESDDPTNTGLEIYAQPPGKSLQSLSLLSGGEQTLTSIALLFAMFLTNPSPICVLDEIDAPLDDANVDRVCNLLDEIAKRGKTRFLVITHHRLSMARMDRLYGVTMSEKGVSHIVSVNLQQSFDFIDKKVA